MGEAQPLIPPCETCTNACRARTKPKPMWRDCKRQLVEQWPCSLWDQERWRSTSHGLEPIGPRRVYAGGDNLHMILCNDPDARQFIADLGEWRRPKAFHCDIKLRLRELQQWLLSWYGLRYPLCTLDLLMLNFGPARRGFWNWRPGCAPATALSEADG